MTVRPHFELYNDTYVSTKPRQRNLRTDRERGLGMGIRRNVKQWRNHMDIRQHNARRYSCAVSHDDVSGLDK
jgi:hypothetical protein